MRSVARVATTRALADASQEGNPQLQAQSFQYGRHVRQSARGQRRLSTFNESCPRTAVIQPRKRARSPSPSDSAARSRGVVVFSENRQNGVLPFELGPMPTARFAT